MIRQNLLPHHWIHRRRLARTAHAWLVALAFAAFMAGSSVIGGFTVRARPPAMPAGLDTQLQTGRDQLAQVRQELEQARHAQAAQLRSTRAPQWSALLDVIGRMANDYARLDAIQVRPEGGSSGMWTVVLVGKAWSTQDIAGFASSLETTELFQEVRTTSAPASGEAKLVGFQFECALAPSLDAGETP
ncbi:MAG: hypothetical protein RIB58_06240 [Phycisphaerales bacterium]